MIEFETNMCSLTCGVERFGPSGYEIEIKGTRVTSKHNFWVTSKHSDFGSLPNTIYGSLPNTRLGFWGLGQGNLGFRGGAWGLP